MLATQAEKMSEDTVPGPKSKMQAESDAEQGPSHQGEARDDDCTCSEGGLRTPEEFLDDITEFLQDKLSAKQLSNKLICELKHKLYKWALFQAKLMGRLEELQTEKACLRDEVSKTDSQVLKGCVGQLEKENQKLKNEVSNTVPTFAAIVASQKQRSTNAAQIQQAVNKQANTVFIGSVDNKDAKEVKTKLTDSINPRKDKIRFISIRTANCCVIVETEDQEDCKKLQEKTKQIKYIRCEPPKKRRPLVIIYRVPKDIDNGNLLDEIYELNLADNLTRS